MLKYIIALAALIAADRIQTVFSHSWLACTDYAEKNARYYDHNLCRGWARSARNLAPRGGTFAADKGFDHHPSENNPCKTARNDATEYDSNHPMAVYYPGQQVVLAHPMKNHGSATCTDAYMPDSSNFIYRGGINAASDPTLSGFKQNLVANLGVKDLFLPLDQYPRPGYQNAPAFCENKDKALGTYSFNVPNNIQPGQYTFIWLWGFNSAQDLYSGCFEVKIVGSLAERNAQLVANGFDNVYEPCGGKTSDFSIPGNTNPGCTNIGGTTTTANPPTLSSTISSTPATTETTTLAPGEQLIPTLTLQMTGEIDLPAAQTGTIKRFLSVHWDCPVVANFWNIRVTGHHDVGSARKRRKRHAQGVHYDLMQEGYEVNTGKFYYHVTFAEPCDLRAYPPITKLLRDEK